MLVFKDTGDAPNLDAGIALPMREAFARGSGEGLWRLGAGGAGKTLPPVFVWWRDFAARFVVALRRRPQDLDEPVGEAVLARIEPPTPAELAALTLTAPLMRISRPEKSSRPMGGVGCHLRPGLCGSRDGFAELPARFNPAWTLIGRVHFNLAENRRDPEFPFAFMATSTTGLSAAARAQHLPLGEALRQYAGANNKNELLSLLQPVQRAAKKCDWLKRMVDAGEIFHPLRWGPQEALSLIRSAPDLEDAGVICGCRRPARRPPTAPQGNGDDRPPRAIGPRT